MVECPDNHTTHRFLICDRKSDCQGHSYDCNAEPVPMFTCDNEVEQVPYSLVCDHRHDCCDNSDENFCVFPPCAREEFSCGDNKQCVSRTARCDNIRHCVDGSDEMNCREPLTASDITSNTKPPPAVVDFTGTGSFVVTSLDSYLTKPPLESSSNKSLNNLYTANTSVSSDTSTTSKNLLVKMKFISKKLSNTSVTSNVSAGFSDRSKPDTSHINFSTTFQSASLNSSVTVATTPFFSNSTKTPVSKSLYASVCPETHFQCFNDGYCLPVYVRCNGVYDCPGREDEERWDVYNCPGFYRCRDSPICVHRDHLCDQLFQCPQHDDELMCNFTCPHNCTCSGHAFVCSSQFPVSLYPDLRYLDAGGSDMSLGDVSQNKLLIHLSLQSCGVRTMGKLDLPNLRSLDLSHNMLTDITGKELDQLKNLRFLSVAFNELMSLKSIAETEFVFPQMIAVNFAGVTVHEINSHFLSIFPHIHRLNLSGSSLQWVLDSGFSVLHQLRVLDLRRCPIKEIRPQLFKGLLKLHTIYADNYKVCCPAVLPEGFDRDNCHAPSDELSSCAALLRADVFRIFLTVYALLALVGNVAGFMYRVFIKELDMKLGFDVFVTQLCLSDFLMGVYLAMIGVADRKYYGTYVWEEMMWKGSAACKTAGFLSMLSSEVSALLICCITAERFLVLSYPYKDLRFTGRSAQIVSCFVWIVGLLLAAVPLLPLNAHWEFYSQSCICIPLPITRQVFAGSDYVFGVMIVLNLVLFLLVALGQILIFRSIRSISKAVSCSNKTSKDAAIARRLLAVVITDFLCWFPIGLLGVLARSGLPISGDVNVAMAIFVLPFNSALNPFLYTFHMLMERRRKLRKLD